MQSQGFFHVFSSDLPYATVSASSQGSVKTELASIAIQASSSDVLASSWKDLRSRGWLFVQQALAQQLVVLASPWLIVK